MILARRAGQLVPVLLGLTLVSFLLVRLVPGDPVEVMLGQLPSPAAVAEVRRQLGLDRPLPVQYLAFLGDLMRGDLGHSIILREPVSSIVGPRIGPTAFLLVYSALLSILFTLPLALVAALRENRLSDHAIRVVTTFGYAMPAFWIGLLLVSFFSPVGLGWFPVSGYGEDFLGRLYYLFLPSLTIAISLTPMLVRSLRASLITVMESEYIEAARARGFGEARVIGKHALRNASIATLTVLMVNIAWLVSGTIVVERVFDIPGLGILLVSSVFSRDYPIISAITLLFGLMVVAVNLAADALYALVDPRARSR